MGLGSMKYACAKDCQEVFFSVVFLLQSSREGKPHARDKRVIRSEASPGYREKKSCPVSGTRSRWMDAVQKVSHQRSHFLQVSLKQPVPAIYAKQLAAKPLR